MFMWAIVNSYFDGSDYNEPVKYYVDDKYYYFLDPNQDKFADFYVKENYAVLYDNTVSNLFEPPANLTHYQISNVREFAKPATDSELVRVGLQFDPQYDIYTRKVYTYLTILGEVGGLQSSLFAIGSLLVAFFSRRLLYAQLIKRTYQVN